MLVKIGLVVVGIHPTSLQEKPELSSTLVFEMVVLFEFLIENNKV